MGVFAGGLGVGVFSGGLGVGVFSGGLGVDVGFAVGSGDNLGIRSLFTTALQTVHLCSLSPSWAVVAALAVIHPPGV